MPILTRKQVINNLLEVLDLPDPMKSIEEWQRLRNKDLDDTTTAFELWRELRRTESKLHMVDPKVLKNVIYLDDRGEYFTAEEWLHERIKKINRLRKPGGVKTNSHQGEQVQGRAEGWI
jgi:hypothetical protein